MTLKLVKDIEEDKPSEEVPELALDAIAEHFKQSDFLGEMKSDDVTEFVLIMRTPSSYVVCGSKSDYDRMVSCLEEAKLSLMLANMQGEYNGE